MASPRDLVHFVGSVPLQDCDAVFRTLAGELGPYVRRLPDGETGKRSRWIYFQREMLESLPVMEADPTVPVLRIHEWNGRLLRETKLLRLKPAVDQGTVAFPTGYAEGARDSWAVFQRLRDNGVIPAGTRFQVSLPTPNSAGYMYISAPGRPAFLAAYERSLLTALRTIVTAIPAVDLTIQWDICQEILVFEDYFPGRPPDYKPVMFAMLGRLGDAVPAAAELGFHLCYGSPADAHLVMPRDAGILVEVMNGIGDAVRRRIDYLHIPVPQDRSDDAYFAPLTGWQHRSETQLYLGLIHHADAEGDQKRIAAARRVVPTFGVSSECGWGRSDPGKLPSLLLGHRLAASVLAGG